MLPTLVRMARSKTYSEAISLLNTCQSNAATIEAIRKSGGRLNDFAVLEMHDYLRRIGYAPDDLNKLNVVHITGTKGKGSTSAFTERILRSHLKGKVGLYTSPHLCAVRERIRVNGEPLSEEVFARLFFEVWEKLEKDPKTPFPHTPVFPIYFRLLTLLAFHAFLSLGVEATVLEVGIGGLYDSTNIVPRPIVTGISALGLDHTAVLGNTIEEIAKNKAGIYKRDVPALSVPQDQEAGGRVLRDTAGEVGAPFEVVEIIKEDVELGVPGAHQRVNASLAVGLARKFLEAKAKGNGVSNGVSPSSSAPSSSSSASSSFDLPESFQKALAETRWPGRCQVVPEKNGQTRWLLDGAHTTESLTSCGQWAWKEGKPDILIFNCSGGRAAETLLGSLLDAGAKAAGMSVEELGGRFEEVVFCTNVTYADGHFQGDLTSKAIDPDDLSALATQNALRDAWLRLNPSFDPAKVHAKGSIQEAVEIARRLGKRDVLVAGSLHLVGGVMSVAELHEALSMA